MPFQLGQMVKWNFHSSVHFHLQAEHVEEHGDLKHEDWQMWRCDK